MVMHRVIIVAIALTIGCTSSPDLTEHGRGSAAAILAYATTLSDAPPVAADAPAEPVGPPIQPPPDRFGNFSREIATWVATLDESAAADVAILAAAYRRAAEQYEAIGLGGITDEIRAVEVAGEIAEWLSRHVSERWQSYDPARNDTVEEFCRVVAEGLEHKIVR